MIIDTDVVLIRRRLFINNIETLVQNASVHRNASGIARWVFLTTFTKFIRAVNSKTPFWVTCKGKTIMITSVTNSTVNGESLQIVHVYILSKYIALGNSD